MIRRTTTLSLDPTHPFRVASPTNKELNERVTRATTPISSSTAYRTQNPPDSNDSATSKNSLGSSEYGQYADIESGNRQDFHQLDFFDFDSLSISTRPRAPVGELMNEEEDRSAMPFKPINELLVTSTKGMKRNRSSTPEIKPSMNENGLFAETGNKRPKHKGAGFDKLLRT